VNRRRFLGAVGAAAFAPGCLRLQSQAGSETTQPGAGDNVVSAAETESGAGEWRAQRFDAANTGYSANGDAPRKVPSVLGELDRSVGQAVDPLFSGDTTYFLTGDGTVLAVDAASGERQWETESVGASLVPEAVVDDSVLAARSLDGRVFGVSRSDGSLREPFSFGAAGFGLTPAGNSQWVAPAFDGWVYGVNPVEQSVVWEEPANGAAMPATVGEEYAYVSIVQGVSVDDVDLANPNTMDAGGLLYVLDLETGERVAQGSRDGFAITPPVLGENNIYWAGFAGEVQARQHGEGNINWRFDAEGSVYRPPALVDDTLVVSTESGAVHGVDVGSGEELWSFSADARVRGGPTAVGDTVYVGSDDSTLYALDAESGDLRWRFETREAVRSVAAGGNRVYAGTTTGMYVLGFE
jgi:outer membrane protein assembly factor BamB